MGVHFAPPALLLYPKRSKFCLHAFHQLQVDVLSWHRTCFALSPSFNPEDCLCASERPPATEGPAIATGVELSLCK